LTKNKGVRRTIETIFGKRKKVYNDGLDGFAGVKTLRETIQRYRNQRDELIKEGKIVEGDTQAIEEAEAELTAVVEKMMEQDPNLGVVLQQMSEYGSIFYTEAIFPDVDTWQDDEKRMDFSELNRHIGNHRYNSNLASMNGYQEAGVSTGEAIKNAGYKYDLIQITNDPNAEEEKQLKAVSHYPETTVNDRLSTQRIAHYLIHNK
jgi:hypothetical protein